MDANADSDTDAAGSAIALPGLCSGELKKHLHIMQTTSAQSHQYVLCKFILHIVPDKELSPNKNYGIFLISP